MATTNYFKKKKQRQLGTQASSLEMVRCTSRATAMHYGYLCVSVSVRICVCVFVFVRERQQTRKKRYDAFATSKFHLFLTHIMQSENATQG